ncbi:helix-turn-helix domain-containing protein [Nocardia altamirensis]|uniref:helix-turn-helix domain-containing protein n=1 Tax=Nocardia altamirensis TaxID=472158 RepID=UPI0008403CDD|nr:helix-turn-helix domain-containing protein [Nocardia altamirensis]
MDDSEMWLRTIGTGGINPAQIFATAENRAESPKAGTPTTVLISDHPQESPRVARVLTWLRSTTHEVGIGREEMYVATGAAVQQAPSASSLRTAVGVAQSVVLVAEVRNSTCSSAINNALDRLDRGCLARKPVGIVVIDESRGTRALDHLRLVMAGLDAVVIPYSPAFADEDLHDGRPPEPVRRFTDELRWFGERLDTIGVESNPADEERGVASAQIEDSIKYIAANYTRCTLSLDDVARAAHMSRFHFSRTFKKHTGTRYIDYVTTLRIKKAQTLLRDTTLSIHEVGAMVGYQDSSHFLRVFKTCCACTPSAFRNAERHSVLSNGA